MPSPEKFRETLTTFAVDEDIIGEMYAGFGEPVSKTPKPRKSAFFRQAIEVMNVRLPKERVQEIIEANACCKSGARLKASQEFAKVHKDDTVEERLRLISERPYLNMGRAALDADGTILVHGVTYVFEDRFACACPTVSRVKRDYAIPREYCYCCGGHFKFHYEIMLGVKLELCEIVSSPHDTDGREPCVFRFRIVG